MFGKDKVKAHNRLTKSKTGYKVIRVHDFLRKKDKNDNTVRSNVLGVTGIAALGIGTALLLKKKGIKFPGQVTDKNPLLSKKPSSPIKVIEETVGTPPKNPVKSGKEFIAQMDEEWGIGKKKVNSNSAFPKIDDPWETPILTKIQKENSNIKSMVPQSENTPLLTGKKIPASRGNLLVTDTRTSKKVTSSVARINEMDKTYKSIDDLSMRASVKIDHYLKRPRKTSDLGRPPKETSLKELLDNPNIKKAQEKVKDRLSRAERKLLQKKARLAKKN